ncbi:MAG: radical SAM protein [Thermoplasmata archaeon]
MTETLKLCKDDIRERTDVLIIDGYVDEPSLLGVPPYISPEPRLISGVLEEHCLNWEYITADEFRNYGLPIADKIIVHGGVTVPGNYLSGTPLTKREAEDIAEKAVVETFLGGPLARFSDVEGYKHYSKKDLSAYFYEYLNGVERDRWTTLHERNRWLVQGAKVVKRHPMYPDPLLAEVGPYRGCPRYITGGCSFCSEPLYGKPEFRDQRDIIEEIGGLYELGIRNFRLGGQSCSLSYKAEGIGEKETPKPIPEEIRELYEGIWKRCEEIKVLHVDNANPSVIANYPDKSEEILECIVENTTSGNVLSLGIESVDEKVIKENNLNSNPDEVIKAVKMINKTGAERGENGMPKLLPGLNFLSGLKCEDSDTYSKNFKFLKDLLDENVLLRRINIRQVMSSDDEFDVKHKSEFKKFKERVRKEVDRPMLRKMLPEGIVLKDVYMEKREGKNTFGRQVGTYPLLIGVEYPLELGKYYDIVVTDYGYRSVTGIHHPFSLKEVSFKQLKAVPGIGKKRAATIFRKQPKTKSDLECIIDDKEDLEKILKFVQFEGD